ncbi:hypothetical protein ACTXKZ_11120 [Brachybacterium alimentarium]|uniref:hypothetical protein n=1 Tax=Brachybacterium alimentarium TaxID=47845 RepID=UPI003FCFDC63
MRADQVFHRVEAVGTALVLQLCFLVAALPLVTVFPAAVALQRQWEDFRGGRVVGLRTYPREFKAAVLQAWWFGVALPVIASAFIVGLIFWRHVPATIGGVATGLLVGLGAVAVAFYLALLTVAERRREGSMVPWFADAGSVLLANVPRFATATAVIVCAWLAASVIPTLLVVTLGIVPALAASKAARSSSQASRS